MYIYIHVSILYNAQYFDMFWDLIYWYLMTCKDTFRSHRLVTIDQPASMLHLQHDCKVCSANQKLGCLSRLLHFSAVIAQAANLTGLSASDQKSTLNTKSAKHGHLACNQHVMPDLEWID